MLLRAVSTFHDEHVRFERRHFRGHEVPILLHGVVARVQQPHPPDLDVEHRRAEDVARVVAPEPYAVVFHDLVEVH